MTILVAHPPEAMPAVRARDLAIAWEAARAAARAGRFGPPWLFRFLRADQSTTDLALNDRDARCWASAMEARWGMDSLAALALCLRLLALIDVLTRASWASLMVRFDAGEAELDTGLLQAAASVPLTPEARFDEESLHRRLAHGSTLPQSLSHPPRRLSSRFGA